jgi:hypothetical protein
VCTHQRREPNITPPDLPEVRDAALAMHQMLYLPQILVAWRSDLSDKKYSPICG